MKSFSRSSLALLSGFVAASVFGMAGEVKAEDSTVSVTLDPVCQFVTAPGNLADSTGNDRLADISFTDGSFSVECNDPQGFGIDAESANGGKLSDGATTPITIDYDLVVNSTAPITGSTTTLTTTAQEVASTTSFDAACAPTSPAAGCSTAFNVTITGTTEVPAGTYTDTITWTIAGN